MTKKDFVLDVVILLAIPFLLILAPFAYMMKLCMETNLMREGYIKNGDIWEKQERRRLFNKYSEENNSVSKTF